MSIRNEVKLGVAALRAFLGAADLEARGVEGLLTLMLFVPTIPRRTVNGMRDMYFALAAMSDNDFATPGRAFRHHFIRAHSRFAASAVNWPQASDRQRVTAGGPAFD